MLPTAPLPPLDAQPTAPPLPQLLGGGLPTRRVRHGGQPAVGGRLPAAGHAPVCGFHDVRQGCWGGGRQPAAAPLRQQRLPVLQLPGRAWRARLLHLATASQLPAPPLLPPPLARPQRPRHASLGWLHGLHSAGRVAWHAPLPARPTEEVGGAGRVGRGRRWRLRDRRCDAGFCCRPAVCCSPTARPAGSPQKPSMRATQRTRAAATAAATKATRTRNSCRWPGQQRRRMGSGSGSGAAPACPAPDEARWPQLQPSPAQQSPPCSELH